MKKSLFIALISATTFFGCSKNDPEPDNQFKGTTWSTDDIAANIIWGGSNYMHLKFIDNSKYEIVEVRKNVVSGLYREGTYSLSNNNNDVALTNTKDGKTNTYRLVDSRTLQALVNGELADKYSPYATYVKQ